MLYTIAVVSNKPCLSAVNPQNQAFYGGKMTEDRLLAVRNVTTEAIDHLHHSLESCPSADTEEQDPKGIKVRETTYRNWEWFRSCLHQRCEEKFIMVNLIIHLDMM